MGTFRFRPLEVLEHRETPASLGGLYAQTWAASNFIQRLADFDWMYNATYRSFVQNFTSGLYQLATNPAVGQMGPLAQSMARMNGAFALGLGSSVGVQVVPATPAPPVPKPTDAGMVNTMPDVNSSSWVTQPGGLKIWDVVQGSGTPVTAGKSVRVFYTGWLAANGTQFDANRSPNAPVSFSLTSGPGGVIDGWVQGIPGMKPGGIRRLYVPAALAYGGTARPGIPANSDLVFEVKLISHT